SLRQTHWTAVGHKATKPVLAAANTNGLAFGAERDDASTHSSHRHHRTQRRDRRRIVDLGQRPHPPFHAHRRGVHRRRKVVHRLRRPHWRPRQDQRLRLHLHGRHHRRRRHDQRRHHLHERPLPPRHDFRPETT